MRNTFILPIVSALLATWPLLAQPQTTAATNSPPWLTKPLTLVDCLNLALQQNGNVLRGKSDLEAAYGVVVQTKAIALPTLQANGNFQGTDEIEKFPAPIVPSPPEKNWAANIQLVQSIYQGGRISSSLRAARLTKEQALLQYQTVIADALLQARVAYYDVLLAAEQIIVEEASVKLLARTLEDQQRRYDAGTVPRFNVLQAEVALANERPRLIQARNAYRIAKNNLVNVLGYHVPPQVWEDIPIELTDKLDSTPYEVQLPAAIAKALANRTELAALRKEESLRQEGVINAKAGYKPNVQLFAGYGARSSIYFDDLGREADGYTAGAQVSWNIFDGFLTKGKVEQAKALQAGSRVDVDNEARAIELEVRTDYSNFIEAREVLESQKKVQEQAEEALRLANARSEAGTGTQLDVLNAQTSLTQARSTQVQALHDYDAARARLERAIGVNVTQAK
ncbi:MAG TPA: TolC family protein [Verrucomicrobiae bacterium]|nr:TolC family protein [Verrucomicrobiae bacterium]